MSRPNFVLIQSDQHRFDCVGVNGASRPRTPNMDRMAAEGVNFSHAFCPIPLCVPARNTMLTGQWPTGHLCIANWDTEAPRPPADDLPVFSRVLHDAGYRLGYVGKWHVHQHKDPTDYGFDEYVPESAYARWREEQGIPPVPTANSWLGEPDPHIIPEQSAMAFGADHAIRMIEEAADKRLPFFVRWDPSEPHLPCRPPEPYASMYPPDEIPPWPSFGDRFEGKPYAQAQQLRTWHLDGWTWEQWAPVVSRYFGEISLLDAQVGRIIDAVDRLGLGPDTLIVYTVDHGDMCGAHGMIDKHFIMYDDVMRVPMIARWPGVIPAGRTCDDFVINSLDLPGTFLELAGLPVPATFRGEGLVPLLRDEGTNGREDVFGMYHGNQFGLFSQRMVRDRRWKYVWNATAEDELYDLETDPAELRNLATDPACAGELARLRRRLVAWMERIEDRLLNRWTRPQILEGLSH